MPKQGNSMNPRDWRAIKLLLLWCLCLAAFLSVDRALSLRKEWVLRNDRLRQVNLSRRALEQELARLAELRSQGLRAFPSEWQSLNEDQFRLKGQDAVLSTVQNNGIGSVRLRSEKVDPVLAGRQLVWTLEGECTLAHWIAAMEGVERSQPFMAIQSFHLDLPGDPWHPEAADSQGPLLKGSLTCCWVIKP
jgi:hypothetical protein